MRQAAERSSRARRPTATSPRRGTSTSCLRPAWARSRRPAKVYLRPETAQGIFINFKNVAQLARRKPPFGIAQIGKAFRNEITPGNFIFRTLEFEQMEMEYFVPPAEAESGTATGSKSASLASPLRSPRESPAGAPARRRRALHHSSGTSDIEYLFPIGWSELEGIANRGDYDLTAARQGLRHQARVGRRRTASGSAVRDRAGAGVNRSMLAFLVDAYDEEVVAERERTVLRLHPQIAP